MGAFQSMFSRLWSKKEVRILILGLVCPLHPPPLLDSFLLDHVLIILVVLQDNAGKTTLLYRLKVWPNRSPRKLSTCNRVASAPSSDTRGRTRLADDMIY